MRALLVALASIPFLLTGCISPDVALGKSPARALPTATAIAVAEAPATALGTERAPHDR